MPGGCQENLAWGTQVLTNHTLNPAKDLEAKKICIVISYLTFWKEKEK